MNFEKLQSPVSIGVEFLNFLVAGIFHIKIPGNGQNGIFALFDELNYPLLYKSKLQKIQIKMKKL